MTTVREAAFDLFRRHGLTTMFGNPGSNELLFLAAFPDDFRYILGLHEGTVMAMADGYAQASGQVPLVNLHAAAGTATSLGVLTNTVYSKSPVVVLSGQQVRDTVGQEVMIANVDAASLPRPLSKWSAEPLSHLDVVRTLGQAIHLATTDPKGPTHVSVPYDDWDREADQNSDLTVAHTVTAAAGLDPAQLAWLVARIDAAASPVLVLGPDVDADHAFDSAVVLAERLSAPVWIAPSPGRCPFPTRHPLFRGVLPANVAGVADLLAAHDLVVVLGAPVFRYHHHHPGRYLAEGTALIQVVNDPDEAARAAFGEAIVAPVGACVAALSDAVAPATREVSPRAVRPHGEDRPDGLHPDTVYALIDELAPEGVIHVVESTSTSETFWNTVGIDRQGSFYSAAAGGLGFGLPAAVGVQIAQPERRVVATIGDGSANFGIVGLWSAAQYRVPVVFVVLKNGRYLALDNFSRRLGAEKTPDFDLVGMDFVKIAAGYGVPGESVSTADGLREALARAFAGDGPVLIEVETHR